MYGNKYLDKIYSNRFEMAGPGCEISNQFLKELINLKVILSI